MRSVRFLFPALLLAISLVGCSSPTSSSSPAAAVVTPPVAPTVSTVVPAVSATAVAINSGLLVTFSGAINPATITNSTFTLVPQGGTAVSGTVTTPTTTTAAFAPAANLSINTVYTATLTTGVKNTSGVALASAKVWTFTTGSTVAAPTVTLTAPSNSATGVSIGTGLTATFNVLIDPTTVTASTFTLSSAAGSVTGTVTNPTTTTATFAPAASLTANTLYTATLTTGVKSAAGIALATAYTWSFTTVATAGLAAVNLDVATTQGTYGGAGQYAILAETTVTSAGSSVITGDVAVSPAAQTYLAGFSLVGTDSDVYRTSAQVTGQLFGADSGVPTPANLTQAVNNMLTAYNDAAGRSNPTQTELGAGDISGLTLAPGLYKWSTGVNINTDVTLNGGPNDVWIFQIAGTLALANATNITLTGGALPQNIFWQSAGTAGVTIGTTAHFQGIVLAQKQITVNTGAVVTGRLLSQTAVTLAATVTVTHP